MTLTVDTILIVSLMMAVFAAVSTIGSSLFLGAGYERLRAGFETLKKQTAFFSNAIHDLDQRVEGVEKQSTYFFEAITDLEQQANTTPEVAQEAPEQIVDTSTEKLITANTNDALHSGADNLLTLDGFINVPVQQSAQLDEEHFSFH